MKRFPILFSLLAPLTLFAQLAQVTTPESKSQSLLDRYQLMKSTSQTFQDYKVIKEVILDKEWRVFSDSVKAVRNNLREAKATITRLESELQGAQLAYKQKEESMSSVEHASTHIGFLGIPFGKGAFIAGVVTIVAVLVAALVLMIGRMKVMYHAMKEKIESFTIISLEFEEYKHKALEKQIKLSRELQNERNKLQELKRV